MKKNKMYTDEMPVQNHKLKARMWSAICYPENMITTWQDDIGDILQLPGVYAIHDQDLDTDGDSRKVHVHIVIVFNNTTTLKNVLEVVNRLSAPDKRCCSCAQPINNIRHMYEYLIHNTESCRKAGKHLYDAVIRICFNNFDIGLLEQVSQADKDAMAKELCDMIMDNHITSFGDFYNFVMSHYDMAYFQTIKSNSGLFERLTKSNYLKDVKTTRGY